MPYELKITVTESYLPHEESAIARSNLIAEAIGDALAAKNLYGPDTVISARPVVEYGNEPLAVEDE